MAAYPSRGRPRCRGRPAEEAAAAAGPVAADESIVPRSAAAGSDMAGASLPYAGSAPSPRTSGRRMMMPNRMA